MSKLLVTALEAQKREAARDAGDAAGKDRSERIKKNKTKKNEEEQAAHLKSRPSQRKTQTQGHYR